MDKTTEEIRELDELEEVVENEINRLWKKGATLEEAAEAGARMAKYIWEKKHADKTIRA